MRINVIGWYGKKNVGDEAFRPAIDKIFENHRVEYITPPMPHTDPDIVVLGGGAVVSPFYLDSLPPNCKRYALGVDLAYESEADLLAAGKFDGVMIRNSRDVRDWKYKLDCPCVAIPDLSFMIRPTGAKVLEKFHPSAPSEKRMAVFATDYVNPAIDRPVAEFGAKAYSFAQNLAKELDRFIQDGWTVYLMCCSTGGYGDDRRMALQLAAFMKYRPVMILDTLSPQEMIDFIAEMNLCVCQRFHAHLFSTIAGTAFVSIEYTRKVRKYLEDLGLKDELTCAAFKGNTFDTSIFKETVDRVLQKPWKKQLRHTASLNFNKLQDVIKTVRKDWLGESP
jgi:polysaccharide pyruvyl transferase WcaK-like protein